MTTTNCCKKECKITNCLEKALFWLSVIAITFSPTQVSIIGKFTPSDLALIFAAIVWVVLLIIKRDRLMLPPISNWVFAAIITFSIIGIVAALAPESIHAIKAPEMLIQIKDGVKQAITQDIAKIIIYLIIGVGIYRSAFTDHQRIRIATYGLLIGVTFAVSLGVFQRIQLKNHYQPERQKRVVFANNFDRLSDEEKVTFEQDKKKVIMGMWKIDESGNNIFTPCSKYKAYLTAETPIQVCSTFGSWSDHGYMPSRFGYCAFLALALPLLLILLASESIIWIRLWIALVIASAGVSFMAGYLFPALIAGLIFASILLKDKNRIFACGITAALIIISIIPWHNRKEIFTEPYQMTVNQADSDYYYEGKPALKKIWGEQQSALNSLRSSPLYGSGPATFGEIAGRSYDTMGDLEKQRLEPDAHSGYLITAIQSGILGLAALFMILGFYFGNAIKTIKTDYNLWVIASCGAILALIFLLLFTYPMVRGTGTLLAMIMGIIASGETLALKKRIINNISNGEEQ
ncbi:MAG: hypothetical protein WCO98_01065 [bacterium]